MFCSVVMLSYVVFGSLVLRCECKQSLTKNRTAYLEGFKLTERRPKNEVKNSGLNPETAVIHIHLPSVIPILFVIVLFRVVSLVIIVLVVVLAFVVCVIVVAIFVVVAVLFFFACHCCRRLVAVAVATAGCGCAGTTPRRS